MSLWNNIFFFSSVFLVYVAFQDISSSHLSNFIFNFKNIRLCCSRFCTTDVFLVL